MGFVARFFLLVMLLSFGEFYVLFWVAERISVLATIGLCILTGVLGGAMVRAQGLHSLRVIQRSMSQGRLPGVEIVAGLILIAIGTMLLTPGFITDTVAFLLLIPPLRRRAASGAMAWIKRRVQIKTAGGFQTRSEGIVIDVEPVSVETEEEDDTEERPALRRQD